MAYELAKAYIQIVPTTKGIKGELSNIMGSEADAAAKSAGSRFGAGFGNALKTVGKMTATTLIAGVGALAAFTKSSVEAGMNFDSSMSQVAATMGKTMDELNSDIQTVMIGEKEWTGSLRDFAKKMGAETKFSATEAADALNYMALAGYDTKTSMEMLPNVLNLAAAGSMDLATASDMVTDTQSALGLSLEETNTMVDQMAAASSRSNTSVQQLGEAMLKIGATARNVKGGTQELSTVLGVLADNGIKGTEGGTHLRNILLSLQQAAVDGAVNFGDFSVSVYDADGNMRSMIDIIGDMQAGMGDLSQEAKDAMISGVFNKTDLAAVNALLGTNKDRFDELTEAIGNSAGAAQAMADTQLDNLSGDITIMKSAFEGLQIAISDGATPALRESVQGITEVINGLNDLVSGVEGGSDRIKNGFTQILQGVKSALPAIIEMFSSVMSAVLEMIPELVGSIVQMLPSLFDQIISAIGKMIPKIVQVLPDLIQACLKLITSLVGHLSEIITPIIKAIPTIIKSFISGLLENLPALVSGVLQLVVGLVSELPSICNEIVQYIPQLFIELAAAIIKCIPQILLAVGELVTNIISTLFGIKDPVEEINNQMTSLGETARDSWGEIQDAMNQEVDVSGLLSSFGKTAGDIESEISRIEGEITNILKTRMSEQEGLRQEDITNIQNYMEQIRQLEEEKLSIYGTQADAQLAIMQNMTNASAEEFMKQFGQLQSYNEQERAELEAHHNSQYVEAQNYYNAMMTDANAYLANGGSATDAYYLAEQAKAQEAYNALILEADTYYNNHIAQIDSREAQALGIITGSQNSYVQGLNNTYAAAATANDAWVAAQANATSAYDYHVWTAQQSQQEAVGAMIASMDDATLKNTSAWLAMVAQAKANGQTLSGDTKTTAENIVGAFDNMPSEMQGAGGDLIKGLAEGMKDYIPELEDTSDMSAQEIVDAIKAYLDINSPSRVMMSVGQNTIAGLVQGLQNTGRSAGSAMQAIGAYMIQGIGYGMQSQSGWLSNIAYNAVRNAVNAAKAAGDIQSPSRVMRDEVGLMLSEGMALGIEDGEPMIVGAVSEIGKEVNGAFDGVSLMEGITQETVGISTRTTGELRQASAETGRLIGTASMETLAASGGNQNDLMQELLLLLARYLPEIVKIIGEKKGISADELAGILVRPMSKELGKLERMNGRGVCMA